MTRTRSQGSQSSFTPCPLFFNLNLHPLSPRVDLRLTSFLMVNKALLLSTTVRPKQKRRKKSQTKNERE